MFLLYNINIYLSMLLGIKFSHTPLQISHTPLNFPHIPYKKTRITPKTDALRVLNYSFESFRFSNQEIFERKLAFFDLALKILSGTIREIRAFIRTPNLNSHIRENFERKLAFFDPKQ